LEEALDLSEWTQQVNLLGFCDWRCVYLSDTGIKLCFKSFVFHPSTTCIRFFMYHTYAYLCIIHMLLYVSYICFFMYHTYASLCIIHTLLYVSYIYEGCPEGIRAFWISQEPVAWSWCNLAASQRRLYRTSVNSHTPVGLVSWQWHAVDWICVLCDRRIQNDRASRPASRQCACHSLVQAFFFWESITSPKSFSPPTAQISLPATSGFSQS
jgi:hypothetical protein